MRRTFWARVLCCLLIIYMHQALADVRHGLDERPTNSACVAPRLPASPTPASLVEAFAPVGGNPLAFLQPVAMEQSPSLPSRWYLVERAGLLKTFTTNFAAAPTVALDLTQRLAFTARDISDSQQWGLAGIALHPKFANNGFAYVTYNAKPKADAARPSSFVHSYLIRLTANASRTAFDATSAKVLLDLPQTWNTHHFGQVQFGPDGYLYIGSGDGARWPQTNSFRAQDPHSLYGKVLRVNVDSGFLPGKNYGIPPTNPFADGVGGAPEVWAMGFRNPWRFTFDRLTGDLWLGDVGQDEWEEVDRIERGGNYGWPLYEGPLCHPAGPYGPADCVPSRYTAPVHAFPHTGGTLAVIAGYVYRGPQIPELAGKFVFGSTLVPNVWALDPKNGYARTDAATQPISGPDSFAQDVNGELYALASRANVVYKIVPSPRGGSGPGVAAKLSGTGCFRAGNPLKLASGVIPYTVNSALWSDGADKIRGMGLPNGSTILPNKTTGDYNLPRGSVLIKTFLYGAAPHETRLLMRHPDGIWRGYTYEWDADGRDATLLPPNSKTKVVPGANGRPVSWTYPSRQQCMVCHNERANVTLGLETVQINGDFHYDSTNRVSNQLSTWDHIGLFSEPMPPANTRAALIERAPTSTSRIRRVRSYLHSNCSYCHNPRTSIANIDFRYSVSMKNMRACNAQPVGTDMGVPNSVLLAPGDETRSIIALRTMRRDFYRVPPQQMPPLGTTRLDTFAQNNIVPWIRDARVCDPEANDDTDHDGVPDVADNCIDKSNPDQADDNKDGYGNRCDGDFNNDGLTSVPADRLRLVDKLGARRNEAAYVAALDLNHDQIIDDQDLAIFEELKDSPPGPSALQP